MTNLNKAVIFRCNTIDGEMSINWAHFVLESLKIREEK